MSKSFRELFDNLDFYTTPVTQPPEGYSSGLGLVAWKLFVCMMDPNTADGSRVSAIREIVDRYQGRPGQVQETVVEVTEEQVRDTMDFEKLTPEESNIFGRMLNKVYGKDPT